MSKREFVYQLGNLLAAANIYVAHTELTEDGNYVTVTFTNGYSKRVCIECDSFAAIILDVTRAAMY